MSLRRNLTVALYVLGILALGASLSLVAFTTYMSGAITTLSDSLRSVYLAQRAEIDLRAYAQTANPATRLMLEQDLRQKLQEARAYAEGPVELKLLARADKNVNAYFRNLYEFEPAVDALHEVVETNLSHADTARREAERLDRVGDFLGIAVAILLIAGVAGVSIWLALFAFRPVFSIRDAMRKFARGDQSARAPELGSAELRSIAAQFNSMADSLVRQRENRLTFLAGVAHDLRNPLSVLKLASMTNSPEKLPIMKRQIEYLDRMIGDLLDASRIEAGHLELRPQEGDARTLVREVFELFRDLSPKHELSMVVPDQPVILSCDSLRIEQVLNNLVSNAIKYSPEGGEVRIKIEDSDHEAVISVSDQGLGIPKDQHHDIFEPFRRGGLTKDQIPGIGLGLSVVRRIVEAHDGRLEVQSELGRGTTFCVWLPRGAGRAAA